MMSGSYHARGCGRPSDLDSLNRSECGISVKEYVLSVEALETLPAGTKPSKVNDIAPPIACGSEGRRKSKRSTIFRERTRKGHHQSNQHWNCFKGSIEKAAERRSETHMGLPERVATILN